MNMKSTTQLLIVLAGILSLSTAVALGDPESEHGSLNDEQKQLMSQLDTDRDGVISQTEAQRHPELAQRFQALDENRDEVLEKAEFARFEVREENVPPRES